MRDASERTASRPRSAASGDVWPWTAEVRRLLACATFGAGLLLLGLCRGGATRPEDAGPPIPALVVDLNEAPAELFSTLPGIGPKLASRIVEARRERPFDSLDDLDRRVKGIGPATMARLAPHLRLDPAAAKSLDRSGRRLTSRGD